MKDSWSVEFWNNGDIHQQTTPAVFTLAETEDIFNSLAGRFDHVELIEWSKKTIKIREKLYKPAKESTYYLAAAWLYHNDYVYFRRDSKESVAIIQKSFYDSLSDIQKGLARTMADQLLQSESKG